MKTSGFSAASGQMLRATALVLAVLVVGAAAIKPAWSQSGQVQVLRGTAAPAQSQVSEVPAGQEGQERFTFIPGLGGVQVLDRAEQRIGRCYRIHTSARHHVIRCRWLPAN